MAGFEPRKDYQPQTIHPGAGVPLSQNPLVQAGVGAVREAMTPPASGSPGVYAPQQLPPAGLPLGASAGGQPPPTPKPPVQPVVDAALKVSGVGAASSAVPPAAPTPAAQGAKPNPVQTQSEQQAASIQQRSQSTPAANIGTAPGKQPAAGGFGVQRLGLNDVQSGQGVVLSADGHSTQISDGFITSFDRGGAITKQEPLAKHDVSPEDQRRIDESKQKDNIFGAEQLYRRNLERAAAFSDPAAKAAGIKAAGDMFGVSLGAVYSPEKQARLGIEKQQADAQTTNAGANVTQAEAQRTTANKPTTPKTEMRTLKLPTGQRNPKTNEPYFQEFEATYDANGSLTAESAEALKAMLTPGQIAKLQAEDQGRGLLTKLFTDDKPRGQLEAEARPLVDQQAQGFGARAQPQAQIDPSRIVMVNGVPHKRVP